MVDFRDEFHLGWLVGVTSQLDVEGEDATSIEGVLMAVDGSLPVERVIILLPSNAVERRV